MNHISRGKIPFYKRQYIINPKFQYSFIAYIIIFTIFGNIVLYVAETTFFWQVFHKAQDKTVSPEYVRNTLDAIFLITSVSLIIIISLFGIFVSNKIAGPLYRLKRHMLDVSYNKTLSECHFREGDNFIEIAEAFNKVVVRLQEEIEKNKKNK